MKHFRKKGVTLVKAKRGDVGFDLKTAEEDLFIEVKGSTKARINFRYFENSEYEKARTCRRNNIPFEVHILSGIGTKSLKHFCIPGDTLLQDARPEIKWSLPMRKSMNEFLI